MDYETAQPSENPFETRLKKNRFHNFIRIYYNPDEKQFRATMTEDDKVTEACTGDTPDEALTSLLSLYEY